MSNEAPAENNSYIKGGYLFVVIVLALIGIVHLITKPAITSPESEAKVLERIAPLAVVEVKKDTGPHVELGGEQVVQNVCSACHAVGAMNSPKLGDKAAWAPRIALGYDTLVQHATNGIRMMPARGGNADLTDNEVKGAVAYMANLGGAKFKAPEVAVSTDAPTAKPAS